jgi:AMP-binding enzyme
MEASPSQQSETVGDGGIMAAIAMAGGVNTAVGPTYIERIIRQLTRATGHEAILSCEGGDVTAIEFLSSVYSYAGALSALGIGRGSLVALLAPNRPEAIAVRYAANLLGACTKCDVEILAQVTSGCRESVSQPSFRQIPAYRSPIGAIRGIRPL